MYIYIYEDIIIHLLSISFSRDLAANINRICMYNYIYLKTSICLSIQLFSWMWNELGSDFGTLATSSLYF